MKPGTLSAVIVGVVLAIGVFVFYISSEPASPPQSDNSQTIAENSSTPDKIISKETIAKHNTQTDCWTIVNGSVYDITPYVPSHPGGAEILRACGADGTSLFNTRTTDSGDQVGSGTPHSNNAQGLLSQFKIGTLEQ